MTTTETLAQKIARILADQKREAAEALKRIMESKGKSGVG
jgi:hypothetical protein